MESRRIPGVGDAQRLARSAGKGAAPWVETFARIGLAAKGAVYVLVGGLAAAAAIGTGGGTMGSGGALTSIADSTLGRVVLALIAIGLLGYVIWNFTRAVLNPENESGGKRLFAVITGLIYGGLGFQAARLALNGGSGGGGGGDGARGWSAQLMQQPFGPWLVGLVGVAIGLYGLHQIWNAWRVDLDDQLALGSMSASGRTWAVRFGRFGLAARGVVLALIGGFFLVAAAQADPSEARGAGGVLGTLEGTPWLLAIVALGLVAYGLYNFVRARFRVIRAV